MMTPNPVPSRSPMLAQRGFTMVELLIAVLLSAVVITMLYTLMSSASRNFELQTQSSVAMDRLNLALDTIRNDIRSSGYQTVPNASFGDPRRYSGMRKACENPAWLGLEPLLAVNLFDGGATLSVSGSDDTAMPPRSYVAGQRPDRLELAGAFRSAVRFTPDAASPGATSITLFNPSLSEDEADYIFDGAILGIVNKQGGMQFARAGAVSWGDPTGTIQLVAGDSFRGEVGNFGPDSPCRFDFLDRSDSVVAMQRVRYDLVQDPSTPTDFLLVREELNASGASLNPVRRYIIARNVVDFQVWFDGVPDFLAAAPNVLVDGALSSDSWVDDEGTVGNADMGYTGAGDSTVEPERARIAYVQLSARLDSATPALDPDGSGTALKQTYDLYPNVEGSEERARVITVRGEVGLANFAFADVR